MNGLNADLSKGVTELKAPNIKKHTIDTHTTDTTQLADHIQQLVGVGVDSKASCYSLASSRRALNELTTLAQLPRRK